MGFEIVDMVPGDWGQVSAIYAEGIATGNATFETSAPPYDRWASGHISGCSLVARDGSRVLGWAALSPVSGRCVYSGVAEVSVYVGAAHRGAGVGAMLLSALVRRSEEKGIWTLQAGIFPENTASIRLHMRCGFREVGVRKGLGKMNGVWRDVALLERRSTITGID